MARPAVFINPDLNTPEDIARAQALLGAIAPNYGKAANVGEGIAQLMIGVGTGIKNRKLAKAETAGRAQGNSAFEKIMGAMSGANTQFPAAPSADGMPSVSTAPVGKVDRSALGGKIAETASSLGIDPTDLATAISYETAGTFDPTKRGPTTQWGQHRGLIQFGEPQAKKYGVDWQNPVGSQLGKDGAVAKYLIDAGVRPGMGMMDIYSAINAGHVGKYNASDAGNGGAPGTVADKVNNQMSGHRRNAEKLMAALGGQQVASLDPSVGMASMAPIPAQNPGIQAIAAAMGNPASNGMAAPQQAPAPMQMAQAAPSVIPPMPQNEASSLDRIIGMNTPLGAPQPQGLDVGMLMQAAQNPWLTDTQKTMVNTLLQQEMQKQDPAYQMQQQAAQVGLQKSQLELQQMQSPGPNIKEVGGRLVQVNPDGTAKEVYAPPPEPVKEPAKPAEIQEYEYAKGQGFPGSFQDWKASQKGGMSLQTNPDGSVTFQQGGNIKPMTEAQSKDTVYAVRAEGSLPLLDDLAGELTGVQGNTLGQLPIVGNAMKPEKFQQAEQAANEFLQAILRKDTGAAITEGEQALYGNTYIPRFGDGAKVIQQKKEARYRALQAMKAGMTPQAILAQEKALQNSGNTPMAPLGTPAPAATPNAPKRLKFNPATGELE